MASTGCKGRAACRCWIIDLARAARLLRNTLSRSHPTVAAAARFCVYMCLRGRICVLQQRAESRRHNVCHTVSTESINNALCDMLIIAKAVAGCDIKLSPRECSSERAHVACRAIKLSVNCARSRERMSAWCVNTPVFT